MTIKQFILLLFISSLWGASFIFMKILTPVFGPMLTSSLRMLIASLTLYLYLLIIKHDIKMRGSMRFFIIVGIVNSALPFILYSFASNNIDASMSVILNSTSPMFGAMFGYLILKEKLNRVAVSGLIVGLIGVSIVSTINQDNVDTLFVLSVFACLLAASFYGFAGNYIKKNIKHLDSKTLTFGSLLMGGIALLPFSFSYGIKGDVTIEIILALLVFGVMCTTVAYIIYYKLINEIGAMKALTVTYLMPIFGVLWANLFLDEVIGVNIVVGSMVILIGVYMVTNKRFSK